MIEPKLVSLARQIYNAYYEVRPDLVNSSTGVAINRVTYQGKLLFSNKPILLPQECFITRTQIESEIA